MFDDGQIERLLFLLTDQWLTQDTDDDIARSWGEFAAIVGAISSARELHVLAAHLNWDYGLDGPRSVARHPHCDRGTLSMLFWLAGPGYAAQRDPKEVSFLHEIRDRFVADDFASRAIAFAPPTPAGTLPDGFPAAMAAPCPGVDLGHVVDAFGLLVAAEWFRRGELETFPSPATPAAVSRSGGAPDREVVSILARFGSAAKHRQAAADAIRDLAIARIRAHA